MQIFIVLILICGCFFRIAYCDETGDDSSSVNVHQPTTFAHKNVQMEGITVLWDEFSDVSCSCKPSSTPTVSEDRILHRRHVNRF